jgi:ammonium transporter, Amt family
MNGCLSGLVAITAGCATVDTWAAVLIGICAGWFYLLGSKLLVYFRIDDAVDAIPVHMVNGAWGVISTGLFTTQERRDLAFGENPHIGWFFEWGRGSANFSLLGAQIVAVIFIFGWTFVTMGAYFYFLKIMGWLRISELEEHVGMDVSRHKGNAYELGKPDQTHVDQLNQSRSYRGVRGMQDPVSPEVDETTTKAVDSPPEEA